MTASGLRRSFRGDASSLRFKTRSSKNLSGRRPDRVWILPHGCERRNQIFGERKVGISDNRNVVRNLQPHSPPPLNKPSSRSSLSPQKPPSAGRILQKLQRQLRESLRVTLRKLCILAPAFFTSFRNASRRRWRSTRAIRTQFSAPIVYAPASANVPRPAGRRALHQCRRDRHVSSSRDRRSPAEYSVPRSRDNAHPKPKRRREI